MQSFRKNKNLKKNKQKVVGGRNPKKYIFEIVPSIRPCAQTSENRKKSTTDSTCKFEVFRHFPEKTLYKCKVLFCLEKPL